MLHFGAACSGGPGVGCALVVFGGGMLEVMEHERGDAIWHGHVDMFFGAIPVES